MSATLDPRSLVARLAERSKTRSEADVQSDVRLLLLHGDLDLDSDDLEVSLESAVGGGLRIDVEVGFTVIETKKDLRNAKQLADGETQLTTYLRRRTDELGQRYVGILTDGATWINYALTPAGLLENVSSIQVSAADPDVDGLKTWLEGVLATKEQISPTPQEITKRLGNGTSSFKLDRSTLAHVHSLCNAMPELRVKRIVWARLLTTAFGTPFPDTDELFIEHTYLVVTAELIAHVLIGLDIRVLAQEPRNLLNGHHFADAQIGGVVESDFFDWVCLHPMGEKFVRDLARRIARFDWRNVEHDVLKTLYESVIRPEVRHALGEYYTPDWLADRMVAELVAEPLKERVLDPACGSGTFLFYAVRHFLRAADEAGLEAADAIERLVEMVFGVDIHPVAVTLARVTYLLAIGRDRLQFRRAFSVPVHLGDSLQWRQDDSLFTRGELVVHAADGAELFTTELRFPASIAQDSHRFDLLVAALSQKATDREPGQQPLPRIKALMNLHKVAEEDRPVLESTFQTLCRLHDERRDHIWGYYVKNLARPYWLAQPANRPSVLLGNPPWLSYRFMMSEMKNWFRTAAEERGLWASSALVTSQDLSGYFVARTVQLYLRDGGKFGFVMPNAVLSRPHFAGFRTGHWPNSRELTNVDFDVPWDLHLVEPPVFPMPAAVVFGRRQSSPGRMGERVSRWSGLLPRDAHGWASVQHCLSESNAAIVRPTGRFRSPYGDRFRQGATLTPRGLLMVELLPPGPLGVSQGQQRIRTLKSSQEKAPWADLPVREGVVESKFVLPVHLGLTLAPFMCLEPALAVIPRVGNAILEAIDEDLDEYPNLARWWREGEALWRASSRDPKSSGDLKMTLTGRINYHRLLQVQLPIPRYRVIYNRSGTRLMAALVDDATSIIDTKLYWGEVASEDEGHYLCATLNSEHVTELVNPKQSKGHFGPRDFYSLPFELPIPQYDADVELHAQLSELGKMAATAARSLNATGTIATVRKAVHQRLRDSGLADRINQAVRLLFASEDA